MASGQGEAQVQQKREHRSRLLLSVVSGAMLGFSFPPSHVGELACFGLIPLLWVFSQVDRMRSALGYGYVAMLVFHVLTLNWTGGYAHMNDPYMMIAGGITMTVHPLFYFIPLAAYFLVKGTFGEKTALIAVPFLWVGYEFSHSLSEWSFPWLTLGNSQSYNLARIQFISATGIYGLSFWVVVINVIGYLLVRRLLEFPSDLFTRQNVALAVLLCVTFLLPAIHGAIILSRAGQSEPSRETAGSVVVGMIQSNVDPWDKWKLGGHQQVELYLKMTRELMANPAGDRPDIVLWPETAIPYYFLSEPDSSFRTYLQSQVQSLGVPVLTGLPQRVFFDDSSKASPSAKRDNRSGKRFDAFNATAFFQPGVEAIPWYGKMKMVPLAERIPYADAFHILDFARWNVGIGGWQLGRDSVLFVERSTGVRFSTPICYESTYPAYVAAYVKKGADFIAIVTIDSWWDKMSGAYQHQQFAVFRAVENRRWIARCAVGGISCYIDPYGRAFDKTELFTQAILKRRIGRGGEMTLYTKYGDWFAEGCLFVGAMFFASAVGQRFLNRKREVQWQSNS